VIQHFTSAKREVAIADAASEGKAIAADVRPHAFAHEETELRVSMPREQLWESPMSKVWMRSAPTPRCLPSLHAVDGATRTWQSSLGFTLLRVMSKTEQVAPRCDPILRSSNRMRARRRGREIGEQSSRATSAFWLTPV
jgi:hypothetical protein